MTQALATSRTGNKDSALSLLAAEPRSGHAFFDVAAKALVRALGYRFGGVVLLNEDGSTARIVALADEDRSASGVSFSLEGTPCGSLYAGLPDNGYSYFCGEVETKYPSFELLGKNVVQSYLGSCFKDDAGIVIGHVFLADDVRRADDEDTRAFLALVAQRVGTQWVRQQSENRLRALTQSRKEMQRHYEAIMQHSQDMLSLVSKEYRYLAVSRRYCDVFRLPPERIVGHTVAEIHGEQVFEDYIRPQFDRCLNGDVIHWQHPIEGSDGPRVVDSHLIPCTNEKGEIEGVVVNARDITESFNLTQQMAYQATHDDLTQLMNRREFESRLKECLAQGEMGESQHALCYLDLDQFKVINDTVGHVAGDEMLKQMATLLHSKIRAQDPFARLGGDEFGLLLRDCTLAEARAMLDQLRSALEAYRFQWEGRTFQVTVSIGVVSITRETRSAHQLLSCADIACYTAKDHGRNRVHLYEMQDVELLRRQRELDFAGQLRGPVQDGRFVLFHQPVASLRGLSSGSAYDEILVRMVGDDGVLIQPGSFVGAAERYGLMRHVDEWVIRTVLNDYDKLFAQHGFPRVAINLSGTSLADESFLRFVRKEIDKSRFNPDKLCFEITETAAINNIMRVRGFIGDLRTLGCHFALDDFGSGLSSLSYLKQFPVDYLKIDGVFVRSMETDKVDRALVDAIGNVARNIGIRSIAEHLETEGALAALRESGIDFAQGFLIQAPRRLQLQSDSCSIQ